MAFYFDRDDISLKGFSTFFKQSSVEEREHAEKFMEYVLLIKCIVSLVYLFNM